MRDALIKLLGALAALAVAAVSLTGCASAPKQWSAGTGEIKIVASTSVWASIAAEALGTELVTAHALIFNINQDPHSFEASARDQLLINQADFVVVNGGGYDDFMTPLVAAAETKPTVVNAVDLVGTRADGNEHIWLDIDRVREFGAALNQQLQTEKPALAAKLEANLQVFNQKLEELATAETNLKNKSAGLKVIQTESLVSYLLEDTGFVDATPKAMTEAVEGDRDIPPLAMQQVQALIDAGQISAILAPFAGHDEQGPQWTGNVTTLGFYEILQQDPDTYEQYDKTYFDYMQSCIATLELGTQQ